MSMLTDAQKKAYQNKLDHRWNVTDFSKEFAHVQDELAEAEAAYKENDMQHMVEELADVAIYLMGMAEMAHMDLGAAISKKMEINETRSYSADGQRVYLHVHKIQISALPPDEQTAVLEETKRDIRVGDTILYFNDTEYKACKVRHVHEDLGFLVLSVVWLPQYEADAIISKQEETP